ncbi:MlaD family protein [Paraconexibacter antarcticus]|uniref:MlaD family protein n=1 Tax=Paraconexibacter antarcticus TaxID=2949664 RepID=A0ABY5DXH0_9ACTN|nr:MlaD family protein [Paraconexibacter antarcticus]UTI66728.1 MlaD family protein [Paraconexibacter antarcticus]
MRRRPAIGAALAVAVLGALLLAWGGGSSGSSYRVDAVFDTAKGLVPGQTVKIAGARVGHVVGVQLVPGPAAKIQLKIPGRYGPFSVDAHCRILPEGLISENYVECDPGRSRVHLPAAADGVPTVPRAHTTVPVTLQNVIDVFAAPTSERLRIVLNELGIATAGRGRELNAVLRRANPSLTQARALTAILDRQNRTIGDAVDQTDRVLGALAGDRRAVRTFVGRAADLSDTLAPASHGIAATVRGLPQALASTDATLGQVRRLTTHATPLLHDVRVAAPALGTTARVLGAFSRRGGPAVDALAQAASTGRRTLPPASRLVGALRRLARAAQPVAPQLRDLLVSLRNTGGIEGVLNLGYTLASMSSGYDAVSHMAGVYIGVAPGCIVANLLNTALPPGCDHRFGAPGHGTVPVNAPGAGPQDQFDTVLSGARANPAARRALPSAPASRRTASALLDFLLR